MLFNKAPTYTIISMLLLSFVLFSCTDSSTGVDTEEDTAVINGSIAESSSQSKQFSADNSASVFTVTAARVSSDGSIQTIEGTETQASSSGQFTLEVDVSMSDHIVVMAENGSTELMGFISTEIENNQSYILKPLDSESTAETKVFARVVAEGKTNLVNKTDIELAITGTIAGEVKTNASAASVLAKGIIAAAEARAEFMAEKASENSAELAKELKANAQFQFEAALDAAGSAEERKAAFDVLVEASIDAYAEAGLEIENVVKLIHLKKNQISESAVETTTNIENGVRLALSFYSAVALDKAMTAKAELSNASEQTVEAIVQAGVDMKAEIESNSGASGEISAVFENYREEVRAAFEGDSSAEASVILTADIEVNADGGAKAEFENMLKVLLTLNSVTEAYTEFYTKVYSSVETAAQAHAEVNLEVSTEIVILMNLFS